ncbi:MAG: hypothetical protein K8L99_23225 [Anaerolineae bacterium]|nr:hypothetical protein [Anaerolineae bacterium]
MLLFALVVLLVGCTIASPPTSTWGPIFTLGQAEQTSAPAFWVDPTGVTASWVGADEAGVHQDARLATVSGASETTVLPLPPVHPYNQRLFPAGEGSSHLLWLDADANFETQLFAAYLTPDLQVARGPVPVTDQVVRRYAALPNGDGSLTVIWSGGLLAEPGLYMQQIDDAGRPSTATRLATGADWPALARSNDSVMHFFWYQPADRTLQYAILQESLSASTVGTLDLQPGDRLQGITAGLDNTHLYLFCNVTRVSGEAQTWYTSHPLDGEQWSTITRFGIAEDQDAEPIQTGFNSGQVAAAQAGAAYASWTTPLIGQFEFLPVATQIEDDLSVVYFQAGEPRGNQRVAPAQLIGFPDLAVDQDRYLYLAWAQPEVSGRANLQLTSLRFSAWAWLQP